VFFLYMMRRVDSPRCGVTVDQVPWADGKHQLTTTYQWFLTTWAKRLSWTDVARAFRTSWDTVFRSVTMAVAWGRTHVDLTRTRAIGVDEIRWQHGGQFLTLAYCGTRAGAGWTCRAGESSYREASCAIRRPNAQLRAFGVPWCGVSSQPLHLG